jgi:zinc transporter 1/2/3
MVVAGILFSIALEQLNIFVAESRKLNQMEATMPVKISDVENLELQGSASVEVIHDHEHFSDASAVGNLLVFESSIALHSVIIGFGLGTQGPNDITAIISLMVALIFHQLFEGLTLGILIAEVQHVDKVGLSDFFMHNLIGLFALGTPVGIVIGICTEETTLGTQVASLGNAFAAGCLVYGGLVEIVSEEMERKVEGDSLYIKPLMVSALTLGCFCMGVLAIWA